MGGVVSPPTALSARQGGVMVRIGLAVLAAVLLGACGSDEARAPAAAAASLSAATGTAANASAGDPVQVVTELYAAELDETPGASPGPMYDAAQRERFFAAELAAALKADQDEGARSQSVGALDFRPLGAGNDPSVEDLKLIAGPATSARARVIADFQSYDERVRLDLILTPEGGTWKVAEIVLPGDEGWSLRQILSLPALAN
jgi:hypothetical protein